MTRRTTGAVSRRDSAAHPPATETKHQAADAAKPSASGLGVLEKAMHLLNIVSARRSPMTFTDLLRACDLPKATLHRILATLVREGLLRHNAYDKTFQLGLRLLELAHDVWSEFDLRVAAQDELARLRDALGETVELTVLDGTCVVILASEPGAEAPGARSAVGQRLPVHASAAGKAIAANLDPSGQRRLVQALDLERFTPRTIVAPAELHAEFDLVRARGYAIEQGERASDRAAVAAPIFDYEGRPIGAVAIATDASRLDAARAHALSSALMGASRSITHSAAGKAVSLATQAPPETTLPVEVRCVSEVRSLLGEGPVWSPRDHALYWVDILTPSVHRYDAATGADTETPLGTMASLVVPKASGGLLVATPGGVMALDLSTRRLTAFCHPEAGRTNVRYNDGKCDRRGRLWVGSMDMAAAANRGHLFCIEANGSWKQVDTGFTVPNGIGWSPDNKTMYVTDTYRQTIYRYDFDLAGGTVGNRRPLITIAASDGKPDGLTVDDQGCLWVALWDAWQIARFSPEGQLMQRLRVPVPRPTSCCFGGDNLDTLFVTSASLRLSEEQLATAPQSGSLFAIQLPDARGLPEAAFAG
ncbi:SMP-30/gluconolactonase/LRE family protein [Variovorax sp. VRV01]|uniref:SMP-30/gluconolactonase/LRE family protein n=1 Tax=Variovorax sp. VRV01 TaxID=2769259 RepID=UPI001CE14136|nr:SMP-30/gluconolactonase/LRE family protein [Variovorax sp. VRV01]